MFVGPEKQLLYLGVVLHGLRNLREEWTATATEQARQRAAADLQPATPRRPVRQHLSTQLGSFGVPEGWDPLIPETLDMWRNQTNTPVVGGMLRSDPAPTSIIDITPLAGWLEADPRDYLRVTTDFRPPFIEAFAAKGLPIQEGPGTLLVNGRPAIWLYHGSSADGLALRNAQVHAVVGAQIVGLQLMTTAQNFSVLIDDFWTVVATTQWS